MAKIDREMERALAVDILAAENRGAQAALRVLLEEHFLWSSPDGKTVMTSFIYKTIDTEALAELVRARLDEM
jgi:hypothetical protein